MAAKVSKVQQGKYVRRGVVKSLTDYFDVPKGKLDIPMVSGLNGALWAPSFYMPTAMAAARLMSFYTWCVDLDLGEMFVNVPMDTKIRSFAGVDLTPLAASLGIALVGTMGGASIHGNVLQKNLLGGTPAIQGTL